MINSLGKKIIGNYSIKVAMKFERISRKYPTLLLKEKKMYKLFADPGHGKNISNSIININ